MNLEHDQIKIIVSELIARACKNEFQADIPKREIYDGLTEPPKPDMGDFAFGCFPLAKLLRSAPPKIAATLAEYINQVLEESHLVQSSVALGPYLNIHFRVSKLSDLVLKCIDDGNLFQQKLTQDTPRTMIEFSQPNTHKEVHVGHMRNLCLGDSLIKLHRYAGHDIVAATFPGDVGTHVAKCLWYLKFHYQGEIPAENKGAWLGEMYSSGHIKLEDEKEGPQFEQNKKQLTEILSQLEKKEGEFFELWKQTREWSIELMKWVYNWADVDFDRWYWESEVDSDSVALIKKYYDDGLFVESEGAIGCDLSEDKLGFCLLIKSDGNGLYATKDIELARRKFEQENIEKNIYIVDNRQSLHFKQVFRTLEKMGFERAKDCFHLAYEFVELPDGAMSSRKGNIVPITDLINSMEQKIAQTHLAQYQQDWDTEKMGSVAKTVAQGAIKFGMLRIDPNKKIVFDMDEWLKLEGESGPYIQYVHARIQSILKKFQDKAGQKPDGRAFTHRLETQLLVKMSQFNEVVLVCVDNYRPSHLCSYLYDLAKLFNSFYAECPIGKAPEEAVQVARLNLAKCVAITLAKGLNLLGIEAPNQM